MNVRHPLPLAPVLCALTLACSPSVATHEGATVAAARAGSLDASADARLIRFTPPAGWSASEARDPDGHEVVTARAPSSCSATIDTWPSLPPTTGGVMSIASTRESTADGVPIKIEKTSMFEGRADEVEGVFVNDGRAYGRIVLRSCTVDETSAALEHVTFSSGLKKKLGH